MNTKVIVHTKTGKKLSYYVEDGSSNELISVRWMGLLKNRDGSARFGRYVIHLSEIDFVEIL